tara:strand:- start:395 stop:1816 length:1422 start_codon:yes stop_codon:yes gene_type:complete
MKETKLKPKNINQSWGGRFSLETSDLVKQFTASVDFDQRLAEKDIECSQAHISMLQKIGVLTSDERELIQKSLREIATSISQGSFEWSDDLEDVHMNIEAALTAKIGDVGKKLHTGRSRNDQVATDIRLWLKDQIDDISVIILGVQKNIVELALAEHDTVMPGFTHLQVAQPITFGHHMLAWNQMLKRDYERLLDCRKRVDYNPLGSAALAGTGFDIDRLHTTHLLGFSKTSENSLDAVSDRDFVIEFCAFASTCMMHLSRMSEELIIWASSQFNFINLSDAFCTGSSIMPQKKNPDIPELIRGKTGRVFGQLMSLLTLMKGQPLAYNRDNQEDKEPLFDSVDTLINCLTIFKDMVPNIQVNRESMLKSAKSGYSTATDLADYLVKKSVPFRDAHKIVGEIVNHAVKSECELVEINLEIMKTFSDVISDDIYNVLTVEGSVQSRSHLGGTAPKEVSRAAKHELESIKILNTKK